MQKFNKRTVRWPKNLHNLGSFDSVGHNFNAGDVSFVRDKYRIMDMR